MPQPYDLQFPDLLGQYQRGWDMQQARNRAPIEAQQRDTIFQNTQNDRSDDEIGVVAGLIAAEPTTEGRASLYMQALPKFKPYIQKKYGITLKDQWDDSMLGEVQKLEEIFASRRNGGGVPAQQQYAQWLLGQVPEADRDQALGVLAGTRARPATGGIGFGEMEMGDGRKRQFRKNPRDGSLEVLMDNGGWVPYGPGVGGGAPPPPQPVPQAGPVALDDQTLRTLLDAPANERPTLLAAMQANAKGQQFNLVPGPDGKPISAASRSPDEQAALTTAAQEQAKIDATLANAPAVNANDAAAAAAKAKAEADAKAASERGAKVALRTQNAGTALDLLTEAEAILPSSTGSGLGAGRDAVAGFFGKSTEGAQGAARLKTISGQLILMQPRMEGPQSDADRKLYAQMAGDLGNEKLPNATRMAALQGMKKLQQKYAGIEESASRRQSLLDKYK